MKKQILSLLLLCSTALSAPAFGMDQNTPGSKPVRVIGGVPLTGATFITMRHTVENKEALTQRLCQVTRDYCQTSMPNPQTLAEIKSLIKRGACPHTRVKLGVCSLKSTALRESTNANEHPELISLFLETNKDLIAAPDLNDALREARSYTRKLIIEHIPDALLKISEIRSSSGSKILCDAVSNGNRDWARFLLQHGAFMYINETDEEDTPLLIAEKNNDPQMQELLFTWGTKPIDKGTRHLKERAIATHRALGIDFNHKVAQNKIHARARVRRIKERLEQTAMHTAGHDIDDEKKDTISKVTEWPRNISINNSSSSTQRRPQI